MGTGVAVGVGVGVEVLVGVYVGSGVMDGVTVGVKVGVIVGVDVMVGDTVAVGVAVAVGSGLRARAAKRPPPPSKTSTNNAIAPTNTQFGPVDCQGGWRRRRDGAAGGRLPLDRDISQPAPNVPHSGGFGEPVLSLYSDLVFLLLLSTPPVCCS